MNAKLAIHLFACGHTLGQIAEVMGKSRDHIARVIGGMADEEYARFVR